MDKVLIVRRQDFEDEYWIAELWVDGEFVYDVMEDS